MAQESESYPPCGFVAGGARSAYYTAVKAAIADVIPEGDRTAALGQLGAFMQASFMVGMFSAGNLLCCRLAASL